jgi:hypothetical protein
MSTTTATAIKPARGSGRRLKYDAPAGSSNLMMNQGRKPRYLLSLTGFLAAGVLLSACQSMLGFSSSLEPEVTQVAVGFAQALVDGDHELANSFLAPEIRSIMTPEQLQSEYEGMTSYTSNPESAHVVFDPQFTMTSWPDKRPSDVGWVYVSIAGDDFLEAVTVIITEVDGELLIREIEWGRP